MKEEFPETSLTLNAEEATMSFRTCPMLSKLVFKLK